MKTILLTTLLVLNAIPAMAALNCTALKREPIGNNNVKETKVSLKQTFSAGKAFIQEAEIEDRAFTVTADNTGSTYLLSITIAPNYTEGVIATTELNVDRRMQVSAIKGELVYKLECSEQR